MKLNWGYRVAILYCSFALFILFLVFRASRENFNLVKPDYYKSAIEYQQQMDKMNNSAALAEKLQIRFSQEAKTASIFFPEGMTAVKGEILFYRPSDASQDLKITAHPDAENRQIVSLAALQKGLWRVQIDWSANGTVYFDEKTLVVQ